MRQVSEDCCLVIVSRHKPSIPNLHGLLGCDLSGLLRAHHLAFSAEEVQTLALLYHHVDLTLEQAEEIVQASGGWITGALASIRASAENGHFVLRPLHSNEPAMYNYLAEQVLDRQPEELRNFLLRSSLLDTFNPYLCAEVLDATVCPQGAGLDGDDRRAIKPERRCWPE